VAANRKMKHKSTHNSTIVSFSTIIRLSKCTMAISMEVIPLSVVDVHSEAEFLTLLVYAQLCMG